jgi:hypothetical protein
MMVFPMGSLDKALSPQLQPLTFLSHLNNIQWISMNRMLIRLNAASLLKMGKELEEDEISDSEYCGVDVSFVSNGSTLVAQSPAQKKVPKKCSRCRYVEGRARVVF